MRGRDRRGARRHRSRPAPHAPRPSARSSTSVAGSPSRRTSTTSAPRGTAGVAQARGPAGPPPEPSAFSAAGPAARSAPPAYVGGEASRAQPRHGDRAERAGRPTRTGPPRPRAGRRPGAAPPPASDDAEDGRVAARRSRRGRASRTAPPAATITATAAAATSTSTTPAAGGGELVGRRRLAAARVRRGRCLASRRGRPCDQLGEHVVEAGGDVVRHAVGLARPRPGRRRRARGGPAPPAQGSLLRHLLAGVRVAARSGSGSGAVVAGSSGGRTRGTAPGSRPGRCPAGAGVRGQQRQQPGPAARAAALHGAGGAVQDLRRSPRRSSPPCRPAPGRPAGRAGSVASAASTAARRSWSTARSAGSTSASAVAGRGDAGTARPRALVEVVGQRVGQPDLAAPQPVEAGVHHDPVQPGGHGGVAAVGVGPPERRDQRVLEGVGGLLAGRRWSAARPPTAGPGAGRTAVPNASGSPSTCAPQQGPVVGSVAGRPRGRLMTRRRSPRPGPGTRRARRAATVSQTTSHWVVTGFFRVRSARGRRRRPRRPCPARRCSTARPRRRARPGSPGRWRLPMQVTFT